METTKDHVRNIYIEKRFIKFGWKITDPHTRKKSEFIIQSENYKKKNYITISSNNDLLPLWADIR